MKVLNVVIEKLQKFTDVELAFEWPRGATGWKAPVVGPILKAMPLECRFDGCMYDMKDENDKFLYKPWCVYTNVVRLLRPLS
eukprot:14023453-Heterocapsa_arctica.AAC.1